MSEINSPLEEARTMLAALPRRPDGLLITSDADVPTCVQLVNLFRASGMGQRQWCAAIGLGATTLGMWLRGRRGRGVPWPALSVALGLPAYVKRAPSDNPHSAYCRRWRATKKAQTQAQRVHEEATHAHAA